jgi:hypothetical protein
VKSSIPHSNAMYDLTPRPTSMSAVMMSQIWGIRRSAIVACCLRCDMRCRDHIWMSIPHCENQPPANPVSHLNRQVLCRAVSLVRWRLHTVCCSLSQPASARDWWRRVGYRAGAPALIACTDLRQNTSRFSETDQVLCERETLHALQWNTD